MSTPRYTPPSCPKCGAKRDASSGRPTRWCSEGCKRSGEAEMSRLQSLLRKFSEGLYANALNPSMPASRHAEVIADMQARFDHLAGVPPAAA
jgi:hypothetical protein